jgi:sodium/potassium-transporting ATPase subunit alpha
MAEERRLSDEIISVAQTAKQSGGSMKKAEESFPPPKRTQRCCGGKQDEGETQQELKGELDMDDHQIIITELLKRLNPGAKSYVNVKFDVAEDLVADANSPFMIDQATIQGLSVETAEKHYEEFGPNELTPPKTKSECEKFLEHIFDFFSILLWIGSILCFIAFGLPEGRTADNLALAIVLAAVVIITGVFGYLQDQKASNLMESFKNMMPKNCTVIRAGGDAVLDAKNLVPGDIVKIKYGEQIPADVRIIWASDDMSVDNSSLTGEPEAIRKTNKFTDENPLETSNLAFFGTTCPKGQAIAVVIKTGDKTVMGRIARLTTSTDTSETPINVEIEFFVTIISVIAITLGVVFFCLGIGILGPEKWATMIAFMIGIIVANVPEGLLITVTVCLTLTANRMASNSVIVKNLKGVETLGSTTCICSDKTGTLTQNIMTVQNLCFNGKIYNANCGVLKDNIDRSTLTYNRMIRIANVCNTAKFDKNSKVDATGKAVPFEITETLADGSTQTKINWNCIGDATESSLIKFIQALDDEDTDVDTMRARFPQLGAIPFNSANKYMVSVNEVDNSDSPLVTMKGAPERVLARCDRVMIDGKIVPLEGEVLEQIVSMQQQCSADGLRVLGFAELELDPEKFPKGFKYETENVNFPVGNDPENPRNTRESTEKLVFIGLYAIIDPPRPQVKAAVGKCKAAGIRVIMVTGDHPATAKAIAKQVGIIWGDTQRGGAVDGPATQEDYEKWNAIRGLTEENPINEDGDRWFDPRLAPAIVVPGWEINAEFSDYWTIGEDGENKSYVISPEKWDDILGHTQIVFARTSPQQKLIIVENCQLRGEIVAVTGDGVNDAPALKKADIGVAMGITGSDVSQQAADMILMDDNFASIVAGIEEGRLIFDNLKKSIAYTLSSNIPEIIPFLLYITIAIPQALSTILILFVDLGTDMVPAISMAWENAENDIMLRPPRDAKRDRLVTKKLIFFAYLQIGVIQALAGLFTFFVVLHDYGYPVHMLYGIAEHDNFGARTMYCKNNADNLVKYVTLNFDPELMQESEMSDVWTPDHFLWYDTVKLSGSRFGDRRMSCTFPGRTIRGPAAWNDAPNAKTANYCSGDTVEDCFDPANRDTYYNADNELYTAGEFVEGYEDQINLINSGYVPYTPWRGKNSPFWDNSWLSRDIYGADSNQYPLQVGGYVPGLGRTYGVANRVSGECSSGTCDEKYTNFDQGFTLGAAIYFQYQSLPRYYASIPVVQASTGTIPYSNADLDGTGTSCGYPQPGAPEPVSCTQEHAQSYMSDYLYFEDRASVTFDTAGTGEFGNGNYTIDLSDGLNVEYMNRRDRYGLSSNTFDMAKKWYGCTDTTYECEVDNSLEGTGCNPACILLQRGYSHANVQFSLESFYGQGFTNLDWSNYRDLGCDLTNAYEKQLSATPVTGGLQSTDFCMFNRAGKEFNVASRMVQREALAHAQSAYFVSIVIVQWADLLICKTRMNSIREQGMLNFFMNFGLIFETICAVILCYTPGLNTGIGFRPIRFLHWFPGIPYSFLIFAYDECRKFLMRRTSYSQTNAVTGQRVRVAGWLERNSYY